MSNWADDSRLLIDIAAAADAIGVHRLCVHDHVVLTDEVDSYVYGSFPHTPAVPWLEATSMLAAFAVATRQIRLCTRILIAPLRTAVLLAKTWATLDSLSGGRMDLGVGMGWHRPEYDASGLDFRARRQLLSETIGACRALWSEMPAKYDGQHIRFEGIYCSPKPVQKRPPVFFSGRLNEENIDRIVQLGDGWITSPGAGIEEIRRGTADLRSCAPGRIEVQAQVSAERGPSQKVDIAASFAPVPALIGAGVTDVNVALGSFCDKPRDAFGVMQTLMDEFTECSARTIATV
ncbi:MAG: TIGR03619 family F420-dependent LLM class oxidoreductase [Acidimicrobiales bacterium]